ncbi:unnamed protein product, partial [Didymodactylos carnosus]
LFEFEIAFVSRYSSLLNKLTKFDKLLQRKQQDNESVTNYYDDIVTLCREAPFESLINFLQVAKKEDLQKTLEKPLNADFKREQPYFTFDIQREPTVQDNVYHHPNSSFRSQRSFVNPLQKSTLSNTHPSANRNQPSFYSISNFRILYIPLISLITKPKIFGGSATDLSINGTGTLTWPPSVTTGK